MEETTLLLISGGLTAGVLKRMEEDNKESISKDEIGTYLMKTALSMAKDIKQSKD